MSRKRLIYRLLPIYLLVTALVLAGMSWLGAREMTRFFYDQKSRDLESMAYAAAGSAAANLETEDFLDINPWARIWILWVSFKRYRHANQLDPTGRSMDSTKTYRIGRSLCPGG